MKTEIKVFTERTQVKSATRVFSRLGTFCLSAWMLVSAVTASAVSGQTVRTYPYHVAWTNVKTASPDQAFPTWDSVGNLLGKPDGNAAQLIIHNGFNDWGEVLVDLGMQVNRGKLKIIHKQEGPGNAKTSSVQLFGDGTTYNLPISSEWTTTEIAFNTPTSSLKLYGGAGGGVGSDSIWSFELITVEFDLADITYSPAVLPYLYAAPPMFSPAGPYISGPTAVTITGGTEGATIYYTLNGSTPSATNGTPYTVPVTVNPGNTLKAIAIPVDFNASEVVSQTYSQDTVRTYPYRVEWTNVKTASPDQPFPTWDSVGNLLGKPDGNAAQLIIHNGYNDWGEILVDLGMQVNRGKLKIIHKQEGPGNTKTCSVQLFGDGTTYDLPISSEWTSTEIMFNTPTSQLKLHCSAGGGVGSDSVWSFDSIAVEFDLADIIYSEAILPYLYAAPPTFTPAGPYISGPTAVTISCGTEGATVYYTLNGSMPSATNGMPYTAAVTVNPGQTLKAIAVPAGFNESEVVSQTYVYPPFSVDAQGRWIRNGVPYIPLVMYLPLDFASAAQAGFTSVMTGIISPDPASIASDLQNLDDAQSHGVGIWWHLCGLFRGQADYDSLRVIVGALKNHPALEAWYLADEPSKFATPVNVLQQAAAIIHELDPYHPVVGLDNTPGNFGTYAPVFDSFLSDPYPIPSNPITRVTDWINQSRSTIRTGESLMVCLQAFGQPYASREPNANEIWNMAYQAVVAGVQGIGWWNGPEYWLSSSGWPEYPQLTGALKSLMPYTVFSDTRQSYTGSGIDAAVFQGTNGTVLVAVNTGSSTASLTVGVQASSFTPIGPIRNASAASVGGNIQLNISGLGCGAWQLSTPTPTPTPTPSLIPGDANGDGKVDVSDLGILAANYGGTGKTWALGDFTGDGKVDVSDLEILAAHYGQGSGGATQAADLQQDMKAVGLSVGSEELATAQEPAQKTDTSPEDSPVAKSLGGCGSAGLPLIAGVVLMSVLLIKLKE